VPAGEFNQNALVNMVFDENEQYYLHSRDTYHYGTQAACRHSRSRTADLGRRPCLHFH
jgi:hypothetical protein